MLIVDDEAPARAELRYLLGRFPQVEVVGEAADADEAAALLRAVRYHVVFLDIQMPGRSGLELGQTVARVRRGADVVFVTAYEQYAVDAFAARAADYLLKPVDESRLRDTVDRLLERRGVGGESRGQARGGRRWALARQAENVFPVPLREVRFFEARGDVVYLHTAAEELATRYTLGELERTLPRGAFFRCHRGYLVNLAHVREIIPFFSGTYLLRLNDSGRTRVPVSRARVSELRSIFGL